MNLQKSKAEPSACVRVLVRSLNSRRWPKHGVISILRQMELHHCLSCWWRWPGRTIQPLTRPRKLYSLCLELAHLDGTEVQFDQIDPQRITIKAVPKTDMVTLRVHIALDYIERQHRECVLKQPAFACLCTEFGWH